MKKVRWGVFGVAKIAVTHVIRPCRRQVLRDRGSCVARSRGPRGGARTRHTEGLRLRVRRDAGGPGDRRGFPIRCPITCTCPWSTRAADGNSVLCEKPIGLNVKEALELMAVREPPASRWARGSMVQNHPQWLRIMELVRGGRIGQLCSAVGTFSYFNSTGRTYEIFASTAAEGCSISGAIRLRRRGWCSGRNR